MHRHTRSMRLASSAMIIAAVVTLVPLHSAAAAATATMQSTTVASCTGGSVDCSDSAIADATGLGGAIDWVQANAEIALCNATQLLNGAGCISQALSSAFSWFTS